MQPAPQPPVYLVSQPYPGWSTQSVPAALAPRNQEAAYAAAPQAMLPAGLPSAQHLGMQYVLVPQQQPQTQTQTLPQQVTLVPSAPAALGPSAWLNNPAYYITAGGGAYYACNPAAAPAPAVSGSQQPLLSPTRSSQTHYVLASQEPNGPAAPIYAYMPPVGPAELQQQQQQQLHQQLQLQLHMQLQAQQVQPSQETLASSKQKRLHSIDAPAASGSQRRAQLSEEEWRQVLATASSVYHEIPEPNVSPDGSAQWDKGSESDCNLFIRNIDTRLTEAMVRELFSCYGEVVSVNVAQHIHNGLAKGFGFVSFKTTQEARRAFSYATMKPIFGRPLNIQWAKKKHDKKLRTPEQKRRYRNLLLRNVPMGTTKADLYRVFSEFGTIESLSITHDTQKVYRMPNGDFLYTNPSTPPATRMDAASSSNHSDEGHSALFPDALSRLPAGASSHSAIGGIEEIIETITAFITYAAEDCAWRATERYCNACPFGGKLPLLGKLVQSDHGDLEVPQVSVHQQPLSSSASVSPSLSSPSRSHGTQNNTSVAASHRSGRESGVCPSGATTESSHAVTELVNLSITSMENGSATKESVNGSPTNGISKDGAAQDRAAGPFRGICDAPPVAAPLEARARGVVPRGGAGGSTDGSKHDVLIPLARSLQQQFKSVDHLPNRTIK